MDIVVGDVLKVLLFFALPGEVTALNVFYFLASSITSGDPTDVLADMGSAAIRYYSQLLPTMSGDVESVRLELAVRDVANDQWDTIAALPFDAITGSSGSNPLPTGTGSQITIYGDVPRRRTRTFYVGLTEDNSNAGILDTEAFVDLALAAADRLDVWSGVHGEYNPGFWSVTQNEFIETVDNSVRVNDIVGYQRRRKQGVGI